MKKTLMAFLLGSTLVLGACGDNGDNVSEEASDANNPQEAADSALGNDIDPEKIVNQKCSSCHGGDLSGGMGPALKNIGSELSEDEILSVIQNGKGSMPKNIIEGAEAEAVAEWLANRK
ncbi:c-type cytochrome [Rossellomorea vietnamensis]|uniref:C-type cytochrome n=2 Tax=Rossellomorea TaxID=2837508 RepID=A0A5D4KFJ6_9BACI|nr:MULTISPECIES: cytochrome c [Rossellomorea]TYR76074.1 c-type cytochrome [Rossellomorea vietnamensis]TYS71397.1 c-type cytochrome [Rossellomorea aquimaris]